MRETPRNEPVLTILEWPGGLAQTPSPVHDYAPMPVAIYDPPPSYEETLPPPSYEECTAKATFILK